LTKIPSGSFAPPRRWILPSRVKPRNMAGDLRSGLFWGCLAVCRSASSAVHGVVGQLVGGLILVAQGVGDLEAVQMCDAATSFLPERAKVGGVDLVLALDLLHHQLRVGDDAQARNLVVKSVLQAAQKAGVLGIVVGAVAEELREFGEDMAGFVGQHGTVTGGAGIASGTAVAVGGYPGCGRGIVGEEGGHEVSVIGRGCRRISLCR
jgi:hypothetical protein